VLFSEKIYIYQLYYKQMKRSLLLVLAKLNKIILPRYSQRDLSKLNKFDKVLIGYRYLVTKNALKK